MRGKLRDFEKVSLRRFVSQAEERRRNEEEEEAEAQNVHRASSLAKRAQQTRVKNLPRRVLNLALDVLDVGTGGFDARRLEGTGGLGGGDAGSPGRGGGRGGRTGGGVRVGGCGRVRGGGGGEHDGGSCETGRAKWSVLCLICRAS